MSKPNENDGQVVSCVPKLRFEGFEGDWEEKKLGDIGKLIAGLTYSPEDVRGDGLLVLRSSNVQDGKITLNDNVYVKANIASANLSKEGDILICVRNGSKSLIGKNALIPKNMPLCTHGAFMTVFRSPFAQFVFQLFQTSAYQNQVNADLGATINSINGSQFIKYKFFMPTLPEQQKIASCLSSLDDLISAESQKLESLKEHKKGLMQKLFPQEGQTVPQLRFEGFDGDWEESLIEDFFGVGSSKRVLQQDWTTQGVPFYRTRELVSLSKRQPFGSEIFISEELFQEISKSYGLPKEGDFLVSGVGTLGICYQVQANDRFYFKDGNVLWFKLKSGIIPTFFKYCFESDGIQNQIIKQSAISTVGTYTIQNAKTTKFLCPLSTQEQQKIASCLSSLDDLITTQADYIHSLKQHKKGLMQQLFPSMDETN